MRTATIRTAVFLCGLVLAATVGNAGRTSIFTRQSPAAPNSANTTRPAGTIVPGKERVRSIHTINRKVMDTSMARMNGERSRIKTEETRAKKVKVYQTRDITVIDTKVTRRASDEVAIPRMSDAEFQKVLEHYQNGMEHPIITRMSPITKEGNTVTLDKINKYSDPAESVDSEGIPVTPAGGNKKKP